VSGDVEQVRIIQLN